MCGGEGWGSWGGVGVWMYWEIMYTNVLESWGLFWLKKTPSQVNQCLMFLWGPITKLSQGERETCQDLPSQQYYNTRMFLTLAACHLSTQDISWEMMAASGLPWILLFCLAPPHQPPQFSQSVLSVLMLPLIWSWLSSLRALSINGSLFPISTAP